MLTVEESLVTSFKILETEMIYHGHAFDVARVRVSLPDGNQKTYDLVQHRPSVTIVPIDDAGAMVFVSQYRIGADKLLLELPAGNLEPAEETATGAGRELREEIGMAARQLVPIGGTYLSPGYSTEWMTFFMASGLYPAPLPSDPDEFLQVVAIPVAEAYRRAAAGDIQDGKTLTAMLLARPHLEAYF